MARPLPLRTAFDQTRDSAFSYDCRACGRCCRDKVIPLNPYEVARLAEHLAMSTTDVLALHTESGGAALRTRDTGECVYFEAGRGCTVHPARPLACRLYPLGRHVDGQGKETYAVIEPHPGSEGIYGDAGFIQDYVNAQGAPPYIEATARYLAALRGLMGAFAAREDGSDVLDDAAAAMQRAPLAVDDNILDVDAVVARKCAESGRPVPESLDERIEIHLRHLADLAGVAE